MNVFKNWNAIYKGILIVQIMLMIDSFFRIFDLESSQALSLLRYFMYFFGVYWLCKGIKGNHYTTPFIYKLFLLWVLYIVITALPELLNPTQNYVAFKAFISGKLFLYVIPFLMCADLGTSTLRSLFRLSYLMGACYMIIAIPIYIGDMMNLSAATSESITFLLEGAIILLLTYSYHNKKTKVISIIAVLIAIVIMMLLARRNKVVFYGGGLSLAIILNVLSGKISGGRKFLIVLVTLAGFIFFISADNIFGGFFDKMETGMSSREQVIDDFTNDFNRTPNDWIFGRGLFGEFDGGVLNTNEETGLRDAIENGYLQLILKGGWIWLGLLILISINSIYNGLFRSNNIFVKGCACLIVLYYLDMVGFGVPVTSLKYIMVFISISICSSPRWRAYSDEELKTQLSI